MLYSLKEETGHERPKDKSTNKNKKYKLRDNTHCLSPHPRPEMNQPPLTFPVPPSFIITIQWRQTSWYRSENQRILPKKKNFSVGWSWFKFNNLGLKGVEKGLKQEVFHIFKWIMYRCFVTLKNLRNLVNGVLTLIRNAIWMRKFFSFKKLYLMRT